MDWRRFLGAVVLVANWPSSLVIMPVNAQATDSVAAGPTSSVRIEKWGQAARRAQLARFALHVHSFLGVDELLNDVGAAGLLHSSARGGFSELISQPCRSRRRLPCCSGVAARLVLDGAPAEHIPEQSEIVPRLEHSGELRHCA
jgi:hypothetical protein